MRRLATALAQTAFEFAGRDAIEEIDDRSLPKEVFQKLHERFDFSVDAAASHKNHQLPFYWTKEENGLAQDWSGHSVYCNPPYSNIEPWVRKAYVMQARAELIVMLLPANRTEQRWWQEWVEPYRDKGEGLRVEFLRGRIRFLQKDRKIIGPNERPPFGCCLLIFERS